MPKTFTVYVRTMVENIVPTHLTHKRLFVVYGKLCSWKARVGRIVFKQAVLCQHAAPRGLCTGVLDVRMNVGEENT